MTNRVAALYDAYWEGFGSGTTHLCYQHRINGPEGWDALSSPEEIARGEVEGKSVPYGYESGIMDVALENGEMMLAACDAYETTCDEAFARIARRTFEGMQCIASVSPEPGFVPRGPHPDEHSYYKDSSRDQTCLFVESMCRFARSPLATPEDRAFIAEKLDAVAHRMERYDYVLMVEDGSRQAHVGWQWTQPTVRGAATLLAHLAAVADVTNDTHWREAYDRFGAEDDGLRWRLLTIDHLDEWGAGTLYSNQHAVTLYTLRRLETDPARRAQLDGLLRTFAERGLNGSVFDGKVWRCYDWAGNWDEEERTTMIPWSEERTNRALAPFGLSLSQPATVFDIFERFDPEQMGAGDADETRVNQKFLFGIPTVAFHKALLSGAPDLVERVAPYVDRMVGLMLEHGERYQKGENFNRSVVVGLHLEGLR